MEMNSGFSMTKSPEDGTASQEKAVRSKSQTAGELWHEFVNSTNLHGIRYVFLKRPLLLRLIWLLILLTSGGYYIFTVVRAFNKFNARPINTLVSKSYVKQMDFPAITICSLNYFALSKVLMMDDNPLFAFSSLNISTCAVTAAVRQSRPCGLSLICCCVPGDESVIIPNCTKQYKEDLLDAVNRSSHVPDIEVFYQHYSQNISEILGPLCEFGWEEEPCYSSDFVPNVTPWGMCYTFNSGVRGQVRAVDTGGVASGLTVVLDAQLPEYTQGKFSEGFKVLVHGQGEYFDEWEGINVAPGTHAVIGISQLRFKNLEKPYATNCVEKKLKVFNTYTSEGCLHECRAEAVIRSCGCRLIGYTGASGVKVCTTKKETTCISFTEATLEEDLCGCEVPCNQIKYVTDVSYSKFPDRGTTASLLESGFYSDETYIRENLVMLQVGFKSLSYEKFEQQPAYDSNALFGEIGGNMGLFLGCSLLTIFEFADFLIGLLAARRGHILHPT